MRGGRAGELGERSVDDAIGDGCTHRKALSVIVHNVLFGRSSDAVMMRELAQRQFQREKVRACVPMLRVLLAAGNVTINEALQRQRRKQLQLPCCLQPRALPTRVVLQQRSAGEEPTPIRMAAAAAGFRFVLANWEEVVVFDGPGQVLGCFGVGVAVGAA